MEKKILKVLKVLKKKYSNLTLYKTIIGIITIIVILNLFNGIYYFIKYNLIKKKQNLETNWLIKYRKKYEIIDHIPPFIDVKIPPGFIGGGWKGYGSEFNTEEYNSIPLRGNHDRDTEGTRMMRGWWPEFNWYEYPNSNDNSKVYIRADQDITRLLYNNKGEILSVICPQFGFCIPKLGCVRVEITVSHVKGWVDENQKKVRGHIKFVGQIWIDDYSKENPPGLIKYIIKNYKGNLPFNKKNSIKISGFSNKELTDPLIPLQDMNDIIPNLHPESYIIVGFKELHIGPLIDSKNKIIDNLIINLANIVHHNMFLKNNIISWQVYGTYPELVDMNEYLKHVEELKHSIELTKNNPLRQKKVPVLNEYGEKPKISEEIIEEILNEIKKVILKRRNQ